MRASKDNVPPDLHEVPLSSVSFPELQIWSSNKIQHLSGTTLAEKDKNLTLSAPIKQDLHENSGERHTPPSTQGPLPFPAPKRNSEIHPGLTKKRLSLADRIIYLSNLDPLPAS